jgi:putative ABC transport system substrate-binding protein
VNRRRLLRSGIALGGLGLLAGCQFLPSPTPSPARVWRIGILGNFPSRQWDAFREGMRELGYVEGENLAIEERWTDGIRDRFPALAAELIALNVEVIVTSGNPGARAAKEASSAVPVVSPNISEAVSSGLIDIELLKGAVPTARRVTFFGESPGPASKPELHAAARTLGLELQTVLAPDPAALDAALQGLAGWQADTLLLDGSALFLLNGARILDAVAKARLPAMYPYEEYVLDGGLMFYGSNQPDLFRRAATHVDKILKGASPAELPLEQPTKFDFVVNLKNAEAIGLAIPPSVLAQATKIIE